MDTNKASAEAQGNILGNIAHIQHLIAEDAAFFGREAKSVQLLAVTKTVSVSAIMEAIKAGQRDFGENYVQEGVEKVQALAAACANVTPPLVWHMIGPVQSNKTRAVAEHFDWLHTLSRSKIAQRLDAQRPAHLPPLQVLLQVNVDAADSKSGLPADEAAVRDLAVLVHGLPHLRLRGLMAMPNPSEDETELLAHYRRAAHLLATLQQEPALAGAQLDTLSMGMSADRRLAIAAGSTLVRVGSAIFGRRPG